MPVNYLASGRGSRVNPIEGRVFPLKVAEHLIERAVLEHEDDDMFDRVPLVIGHVKNRSPNQGCGWPDDPNTINSQIMRRSCSILLGPPLQDSLKKLALRDSARSVLRSRHYLDAPAEDVLDELDDPQPRFRRSTIRSTLPKLANNPPLLQRMQVSQNILGVERKGFEPRFEDVLEAPVPPLDKFADLLVARLLKRSEPLLPF